MDAIEARRKNIIGPHLTSREGAMWGVLDPALILFSLFLFLIIVFIAQQIPAESVARGFVIGGGTGLLANIVLALPSRLVFPSSGEISDSRIEAVLDAGGYYWRSTDRCFAPKRFPRLQFPGQWIRVLHTDRGTELIGPLVPLRRIRNLF